MTINYDQMLGAPPQGLDEIPQQEIFLEVLADKELTYLPKSMTGPGAKRKKIYLDEIAFMSSSVLNGFRQFVAAEVAALSTTTDAYWENPARDRNNRDDQSGYRKLIFKKKIHLLFNRELDKEYFFRRELHIKEADVLQEAPWLEKFAMPKDEERFSARYFNGLRIANGLKELLKNLKTKVGEKIYKECFDGRLIRWLSEEELDSEAFILYLTKTKKDRLIKSIMEEPR